MKKSVIFIILLVIVALVTVGIIKQDAFSGGTILSISRADFISSSSDLQGDDAFLIDAIINRGGESMKATITPEMIRQYGIEQVPAGNIDIEFNLKDVKCNYQITAQNEPIYKVYQATVRHSLATTRCGSSTAEVGRNSCPYDKIDLNTVKQACKGEWGQASRVWWGGKVHAPEYCGKTFAPTGSDLASPGNPISGGNCDDLVNLVAAPQRPDLGQEASEWCYMMPREIAAGFDGDHWEVTHIAGLPTMEGYKIGTTPSPSFTVEVIVTNEDGEKAVTTLNEKQTTNFLNDIGRIKFVGSLVAQEFCGQPAIDDILVKDFASGQFRTVDRNNYQRYQDNLFELSNFDNNYYNVERQDPGIGKDVLNAKMSSLNADWNRLSTQDKTTNCELNNLIYSCTPEKDLIYPEIQLILKASWVGIVLVNGAPQIGDIELAPKIYDGESSFIGVDIKNIGKEVDSFDVSVKCSTPLGLGSHRETILAGETKKVLLPFASTAGDYICNIETYSVNSPDKKDVKSFDMTILERDVPKIEQCEEISNRPSEKCILQGYPVCDWYCFDEPADYTWIFIGIGTVILLLVVFVAAKKK